MSRISDGATGVTLALVVAGLMLVTAGVSGLGAGPVLVLVLAFSISVFALVRVVVDEGGVDALLARGQSDAGASGSLADAGHSGRPTDTESSGDLFFWGSLSGLVVAMLIVVVLGGARPGELQTIGGIVGLVGVINYFLKPVYLAVFLLGSFVAELARDAQS